MVLATSREGLALDGEQIFAVPSMGTPDSDADLDAVARADAADLFVRRARLVDADFLLTVDNASAVAQVCRRLDGVPLAIELAAARVNAMTPAELAQGLDHRFDTLSGGRRRAVQRHQTLRAAIDWSYELLSEPERRLLARLSVFAGGCTRASASAVCGGDPVDPPIVLGLLTDLVARSLVVARARWAGDPVPAVGDYPRVRRRPLGEYGETEVIRRRHAEHYENLSRSLNERIRGPEEPIALRLLGAENENLLAAMTYAVDNNDVDLALRLLAASAVQAQWVVGQPLPLDALTMAGAAQHPLYPRALATAAFLAVERGDAQAAERLADAAIAAGAGLASPDPLVDYLVHSTRARTTNMLAGLLTEAEHQRLAADATRSKGLEYEHAASLGTAASSMAMSGDADGAIPLAREALAVSRQHGARGAIAWSLTAFSAVLAREDPDQAKVLLDESERTASCSATQTSVCLLLPSSSQVIWVTGTGSSTRHPSLCEGSTGPAGGTVWREC